MNNSESEPLVALGCFGPNCRTLQTDIEQCRQTRHNSPAYALPPLIFPAQSILGSMYLTQIGTKTKKTSAF